MIKELPSTVLPIEPGRSFLPLRVQQHIRRRIISVACLDLLPVRISLRERILSSPDLLERCAQGRFPGLHRGSSLPAFVSVLADRMLIDRSQATEYLTMYESALRTKAVEEDEYSAFLALFVAILRRLKN